VTSNQIMVYALAATLSLSVESCGRAASGDVYEACPTEPTAEDAEARCLAAIADAERGHGSPDLPHLLEALALILERDQRYEEAIVALRRSIEAPGSADSPNARRRLSGLLEKFGQLREAAQILESLISERTAASRGETMLRGIDELRLADLYVKLEEPELAERNLKRSIDDLSQAPGADPTLPAVVRLVRLYLNQGRAADALEVCRKHEKWSPAQPASVEECDTLRAP